MKWWYRTEGAGIFAAALALYFHADGPWWLLLVLGLAPDLSAVGYLAGPRLGSLTYNLVHTYVGPTALAALSVLGGWSLGLQLALIWLAHIGIDRALGYTLKRPTDTFGRPRPSVGPAAEPTS